MFFFFYIFKLRERTVLDEIFLMAPSRPEKMCTSCRVARSGPVFSQPFMVCRPLPKTLNTCVPWSSIKIPNFVLGFAILRQSYLVKASARGLRRTAPCPQGGLRAPVEKPWSRPGWASVITCGSHWAFKIWQGPGRQQMFWMLMWTNISDR